ncbi:MAG: Uma2 family endonuclease [Cyanophyceae cyanobacterium]
MPKPLRSLSDDLGRKRLLYERLGSQEYWVVDVSHHQLFDFEIEAGHSGEIQQSRVLPGLDLSLVEEVMERSQTEDDGSLGRWLMQELSQPEIQ